MSSRKRFPPEYYRNSGAVELTGKNIGVTIGINELVFINVYEEEYKSKQNEEIHNVANSVKKAFPRRKGIIIGVVNGQKDESELLRLGCSSRNGLFIFRNGERVWHQNCTVAFKDCVYGELKDPIKQFSNNKELETSEKTKHLIVGYFDRENMPEFGSFRRVAHNLKESCQFYVRYEYSFNNKTSPSMRPPNQPTIVFRSGNSRSSRIERDTFKGCVKNYDDLNFWAHKKCMVREMTLDNFEELYHDKRSLVILFYNPSNHKCVKDFCDIIGRILINRKHDLHCITIDGLTFAGLLPQYEKNKRDLPFIVNDGFIFPHFRDIYAPRKLNLFLANTYSSDQEYASYSVRMDAFVTSMRKKSVLRSHLT